MFSVVTALDCQSLIVLVRHIKQAGEKNVTASAFCTMHATALIPPECCRHTGHVLGNHCTCWQTVHGYETKRLLRVSSRAVWHHKLCLSSLECSVRQECFAFYWYLFTIHHFELYSHSYEISFECNLVATL
jgi:hypothetical protein